MTMHRLALLLLGLFALAGCWAGGDFYAASERRQPVPAGDYRAEELTRGTIDSGAIRLSYRPDGLARVVPIDPAGNEDAGDARLLGLAAIDAGNRLFAAWQVNEQAPAADRLHLYMLLRQEQNGGFTFFLPICDGATAAAATAAGAAIVGGGGSPVCNFRTRATLEAAFRAAEPGLAIGVRLTPLARD